MLYLESKVKIDEYRKKSTGGQPYIGGPLAGWHISVCTYWKYKNAVYPRICHIDRVGIIVSCVPYYIEVTGV